MNRGITWKRVIYPGGRIHPAHGVHAICKKTLNFSVEYVIILWCKSPEGRYLTPYIVLRTEVFKTGPGGRYSAIQ